MKAFSTSGQGPAGELARAFFLEGELDRAGARVAFDGRGGDERLAVVIHPEQAGLVE
ncbi:MAG: hypothetical protein ABIF71_13300 [Planctomycetota bacterium]